MSINPASLQWHTTTDKNREVHSLFLDTSQNDCTLEVWRYTDKAKREPAIALNESDHVTKWFDLWHWTILLEHEITEEQAVTAGTLSATIDVHEARRQGIGAAIAWFDSQVTRFAKLQRIAIVAENCTKC